MMNLVVSVCFYADLGWLLDMCVVILQVWRTEAVLSISENNLRWKIKERK